jgi:hypothetical protein
VVSPSGPVFAFPTADGGYAPAGARATSPEGDAVVEFCIHFANLFYLASFLGRDMLWLRTLTCGGLIFGIIFFTCRPSPMYGPTVWHVVFLGINLYQIWRIILDRRQLMLTEEQKRVAEEAFRHLSHEQLVTLLTRAMCHNPKTLRDMGQLSREQLSEEERALRDIAFSRLSRQELLILLTRRLWNVLARLSPARWARRGSGRAAVPAEAGLAATSAA